MENEGGLRALELSIHLSNIEFFNVIFETECAYKTKVEKVGVHEFCWYDITEHESIGDNTRVDCSPIRLITELEERVFEDSNTGKSLRSQVFQQWFNNKLKANIPFLVLWCLLRVIHVVMFYISISVGGTEFPRPSQRKQYPKSQRNCK